MSKQGSHGFVKRFRQAFVLIAKTISKMEKLTDIFVLIALHKVVFSHIQRKIVFLSRKHPILHQKRTYGCSATLELGSCDRSMAGKKPCRTYVVHSSKAKGEDKDQKI